MSEAIARGLVSAPGFFTDPELRAAYLRVTWVGPPRGMIDQLKEANANVVMEDRGWKTGQMITAELTGGNWDQNHKRRVKELNTRKRDGAFLKDGVLTLPDGKEELDEPDETEGEFGDLE